MTNARQPETPQPEEKTDELHKQPDQEKISRRGKPVHTTPKPKKQNPISAAISSWLRESPPNYLSDALGSDNENTNIQSLLIEKAPKRWVVYEPMVLLPSGSFTSAPWPEILASCTVEQKAALWAKILREISPPGALTHLAINEGIPLNVHGDASSHNDGEGGDEENTLRSPSGLRLLYGDFGPALPANKAPTADDFENAFWVSTKQNGITQIWAPRYTMFSRGNIKEKARLLNDFPAAFPAKPSKRPDRTKGNEETERAKKEDIPEQAEKWAIDLYAGIGYFVFSYAKLGFRLLCWEINPWSVEGLRRGALANGWDVVVFSPCSNGSDSSDNGERDDYDDKLAELVTGTDTETGTCASPEEISPRKKSTTNRPQIIVLLESNEFAERRIQRLRQSLRSRSNSSDDSKSDTNLTVLDVVHINCGFLPSSDKIWPDAWRIMIPSRQGEKHQILDRDVNGWLHLHENVGVRDIETRKAEIQGLFDCWSAIVSSNEKEQTGEAAQESDEPTAGVVAKVEHVEMVKTFAPDVWHVVFDVHVTAQ
ncbi:S-adenosyl-L-methionine-dependent methyltransferase [Naviculisporaceae sp. PSN 640]